MLHGDLLILLCDQPARSYLVAIDKATGKDRWKADRGQGRSSYSTPLVVEGAFGAELIVNSTERIDAYDVKTGRSSGTRARPAALPCRRRCSTTA